MRIITKSELLKQKEGTIFSFYKNQTFGALGIFLCAKGANDFYYRNPTAIDCHINHEAEILADAEKNGTEFRLDSSCGESEGDFDDAKLYALWDESDIKNLKNLINEFHP